VVLPDPVPPEIRNATLDATNACSTSAIWVQIEPLATQSSKENERRAGTRSDKQVPGSAMVASTACKRVPSASRASTNGQASSNRRPTLAASRVAS